MDFSTYGDAQAHQQSHHHQQYAVDPSQAYQQADYYYQQYSAHQPYLHHQNAAAGATANSAAYYYPQDYSSAASGGSAAGSGADGQLIASSYTHQVHAEPNIHPPGIDLSNLAQVAAAAAAKQPNGYFAQAVMEQQPHGNPMPPFPHLIAGPAEPGRMMSGFRENQWGGKRGGFGPPRGVSRVQKLCPNPRLVGHFS